jgi:hypothetical protein
MKITPTTKMVRRDHWYGRKENTRVSTKNIPRNGIIAPIIIAAIPLVLVLHLLMTDSRLSARGAAVTLLRWVCLTYVLVEVPGAKVSGGSRSMTSFRSSPCSILME